MINIWDIYAKFYDIFIGKSQINKELFDYIKKYLSEDDIIYDGACGTGIFSIELSNYVKEIYACDLSQNMLEQTNKKIKKHKIKNIHTSKQDIRDIEFPDNTFDVALAPNVIHLLDNPQKALSQLKRIVKDDGLIIIPTYVTKVENKFLQKIGKTIFALIGFKPNTWTINEYIRILEENNMNILEYKTFKLKRYECTVIIRNK